MFDKKEIALTIIFPLSDPRIKIIVLNSPQVQIRSDPPVVLLPKDWSSLNCTSHQSQLNRNRVYYPPIVSTIVLKTIDPIYNPGKYKSNLNM